MTTRLKIAALSLGLAVALGGAASASADSRFDAGRDHRGHVEARFERHHHRMAERHRFSHENGRFGPHVGR